MARAATLAVWAALFGSGCRAPIEGDWVSFGALGNGQQNQLSAGTANDAAATIFATRQADPTHWVRFTFNGGWQQDGDSFDFDLTCAGCSTCTGACGADDFTMSCQIIDDGSGQGYKLDCSGNFKWKSYPFNWVQVD